MSDRPTIADVSMTGYLYYPAEEFGFDIAKDHPAIGAWLERMKALPGWKHPYELMPGYPFGTQGYRNQVILQWASVQPCRALVVGRAHLARSHHRRIGGNRCGGCGGQLAASLR